MINRFGGSRLLGGGLALPAALGGSDDAAIEADGEEGLLLLVGKVDQVAELGDQLLGAGIGALGGLDSALVLVIAETHHLDEAAAGFGGRPVGADLLVDLEGIAAETGHDLAESAQKALVLDALFRGDNIAVGLQKHRVISLPPNRAAAFCHNLLPLTNMPLDGGELRGYPPRMDAKQRAAEAAVAYVKSDSVIGLGTGSTADLFLIALAAALREGRLRNVRGVPTSSTCEKRARELGIPLTTLPENPQLDVAVDGADEVSPKLDLIKGMGGALLREKIVAQNSKRFVVMVDASKRVEVLGTKGPLPVEVAQFGHEAQERFLRSLGGVPKLRIKSDGSPFITDNGNYIYECKFPGIPRPDVLEAALERRAGIVESGLFLGMASVVLVGDTKGITTLTR